MGYHYKEHYNVKFDLPGNYVFYRFLYQTTVEKNLVLIFRAYFIFINNSIASVFSCDFAKIVATRQ